MPCTTISLTEQSKRRRAAALVRLGESLTRGTVQAVIGPAGSIAFRGWNDPEKDALTDLCAYRLLANTPAMRMALLRAEAMAGRKLSAQAVAAGIHSHDSGATWNKGH